MNFSLLSTPVHLRDDVWEEKFLEHLVASNLVLADTAPRTAPDGWPYLFAHLEGTSFSPLQTQDSAVHILHWLSHKGAGLVIENPAAQEPDYVFPYGMIWNFQMTGRFLSKDVFTDASQLKASETSANSQRPQSSQVPFDQNTTLCSASSQALPSFARKILAEFFFHHGISTPKILMRKPTDSHSAPTLIFSSESLQVKPNEKSAQILEALSWFFPLHYQLEMVSEKESGIQSFEKI